MFKGRYINYAIFAVYLAALVIGGYDPFDTPQLAKFARILVWVIVVPFGIAHAYFWFRYRRVERGDRVNGPRDG